MPCAGDLEGFEARPQCSSDIAHGNLADGEILAGGNAVAEENGTVVNKMQPLPLVRVKAYYCASFCFYATYMRYMTLYFEHDGLSASEIGAIWSLYRGLTICSTPLWAAAADHTKRARTLVQGSLVAGAIPFLSLAIPLGPSAPRFMTRALAVGAFGLLGSAQTSLCDALAIAACAQDVDRWGKARLYGAVGWGVMHLFLGPLMDKFGFVVLFASFILFLLALHMVVRWSTPEACGHAKKDVTFRAVFSILSRNMQFFVNICFIGAGFSMVEGMLFLLLQELQASTLLCGLSVVVTVVFELPIFQYAKPLLARLGTRNMILLGQAAWVVRAVFYWQMSVPWTVLLIEPLHGVTFALVWTAATQHVANPAVSGEGLEASAQGLLQVCFMGVGPVLGLVGGGLLFDWIGSHAAYAVFATCVGGSGLMYAWQGGEVQGTSTEDECSLAAARSAPLGEVVGSPSERSSMVKGEDVGTEGSALTPVHA